MYKQKFILWPNMPTVKHSTLEYIRYLDQSRTWEVTVSQYRKSKSQAQLGYLFAVVLPTIQKHVEDSTGDHYSIDDLYQWHVEKYAQKAIVTVAGQSAAVTKSASKMNTKDMAEFIDAIIRHASMDMNLVIPEAA